jgi:hypothetical protein
VKVFDKLCCSFGQDIFDSLYWALISHSSPSTAPSLSAAPAGSLEGAKKPIGRLKPFTHFLVALVYTCI